jgi:hypothetical protein
MLFFILCSPIPPVLEPVFPPQVCFNVSVTPNLHHMTRHTRYRVCKNIVTIRAVLSDMNNAADFCANKANLC